MKYAEPDHIGLWRMVHIALGSCHPVTVVDELHAYCVPLTASLMFVARIGGTFVRVARFSWGACSPRTAVHDPAGEVN